MDEVSKYILYIGQGVSLPPHASFQQHRFISSLVFSSPPLSPGHSCCLPNMATTTITQEATRPNIGVYTDPEHKLWVAESKPTQEEVTSGTGLKEGEVTVAIKSTGICGFVSLFPGPMAFSVSL